MKSISLFLIYFLFLGVMADGVAQIERISVDTASAEATGGSYQAVISQDGSIIAFRSNAENLVPSDTNGWPDIFLRDLNAGTTERISLTDGGDERASYSKAPSISDDGQIVVFEGRVSGITTVLVFDRIADTIFHPLPDTFSGGPGPMATARLKPSISGDGQHFAFHSASTLQNLFPVAIRPINDDQSTLADVFTYDRIAMPTPPVERASRLSNGDSLGADNRAPMLGETGRFVAFESYSDLLATDTNDRADVLLKDLDNGLLELISANTIGDSGNNDSRGADLSDDGTVIAFSSLASDLVGGDQNDKWDIFVRDRTAGTTTRVSVASSGAEADQHSHEPSISGDGRFVAFRSNASNLVSGDGNRRPDIFVHDRQTEQTARVGVPPGDEPNGSSANPSISGDGRWIVFESDASNLVANDTNQARDIFRAPNPLFPTRSGE